MAGSVPVPAGRRAPLREVLDALEPAAHIVLTTHVNADGDGAGSEAALAAWLRGRGKDVTIINPTPFPDLYAHLLDAPALAVEPNSEEGRRAAKDADLFVVLDTGEPGRIGRVRKLIGDRPVVVIDHHPPPDSGIDAATGIQDPGACATGELIYDLLVLAGMGDEPWPSAVVEGIYAAILTDTGSFRFSNASARSHRIAAELIDRGIDPEAVYRRIYATMPLRRIRLLRIALENLHVDPELPLTWITIPPGVMQRLHATSDDLDGVVDYARAVEGTELALLLRQTADGATKVSFRSNGAVDVNTLARRFGGGGHARAAGALIGQPLDTAAGDVLDAARDALEAVERDAEIS